MRTNGRLPDGIHNLGQVLRNRIEDMHDPPW